MSSIHSQQATADGIHGILAYFFANSTARDAVGAYYSYDIGKVCKLTSDSTLWILSSVASPGLSATPTWTSLGSGGGGGGAAAQANNTITGNISGSTAVPVGLTPSQVKTLLAIASSDVSGLGALALLASVDLSGSQATGILAAARFPALTGAITTVAGAVATTLANSIVGLSNLANLAANSVIGNVTGSAATPTAVPLSSTSTVSSLVYRDSSGNAQTNNQRQGYTTTATAGGTTALTVGSTYLQFFTGTLAQTIQLPDVTTLVLGHQFYIRNNSTGLVTINSSGGNLLRIIGPGTRAIVTCVLVTGTTAASWSAMYLGINISDGKVLSTQNNLTLSGTDGNSLSINSVGASVSGANTGDQTITLTSDVTGSGVGSFAATLATVNSNVGTFGSATVSAIPTVNAKGLITAVSTATITPAIGSVTGLGTGVATALGNAINAASGLIGFSGALGTPTSGTLTNCTFPTLNQNTTGNAGTATTFQTARNINGVSFNGSADITVAAAAGTLTGATLASGVTASSLTSFGASIALGTPASGTLTNATGLPIVGGTTGTLTFGRGGTGLTALGSGLQVLRTNAGATAMEWATVSGSGLTHPQVLARGLGA